MFRDFAALAALYMIHPKAQEYGILGMIVWWNLMGKYLDRVDR